MIKNGMGRGRAVRRAEKAAVRRAECKGGGDTALVVRRAPAEWCEGRRRAEKGGEGRPPPENGGLRTPIKGGAPRRCSNECTR